MIDEMDGFTLGVHDIPDWFMDHVSSNRVLIFGERGYLTHALFDHAQAAVQRVRGDWIERRWVEAVLRQRTKP